MTHWKDVYWPNCDVLYYKQTIWWHLWVPKRYLGTLFRQIVALNIFTTGWHVYVKFEDGLCGSQRSRNTFFQHFINLKSLNFCPIVNKLGKYRYSIYSAQNWAILAQRSENTFLQTCVSPLKDVILKLYIQSIFELWYVASIEPE